ncbi:MAG: hypothetical protein ACR2JO_10580 [Mycobacteriales bacterium]
MESLEPAAVRSSGALVVRARTGAVVRAPGRRLPTALPSRLLQLARNPAVVATLTTAGTAITAAAVRHALRRVPVPASRAPSAVGLSGRVTHHVYVTRHVIHAWFALGPPTQAH